MNNPHLLSALRISMLYALFGALWISFSDRLLNLIAGDTHRLTQLQTYKGWAFVAVTDLLLYFLLRRELQVREQAKALLKRERNFVSAVLDTTGALVVVLDRDIQFNRTCEKTTGYSFGEVKGRHIWDLFLVPEEVESIIAVFERLQAGQLPNGHENYWVTRDGSRRLLAWSNTVLPDNAGSVEYIIGTGIDITGRKRMEEVLRRSEEHFRSLIENASDIVTILDSDRTIRYESPSVKRVFGYGQEELIGKNVFELIHPDDVPNVINTFTHVIQNPGVVQSAEFRFRHKDGSWRILESIGKYLLDDQAVAGVVVNSRDVTDRKQVEKALRESEDKYRTIFETTGTATIIIEEDTTISLANTESEKLSGYSKEEVEEKKSWTEFVAKDDLEGMKEYHHVRRVDSDAAPRNYEFRLIDRHGNVKDIFMTIALIPGTKKSVASLLDITVRKQMEDELRKHRDHLEELVRERTYELETANEQLQREITERKQAEEALRSTQQRLMDIIEFLPDATYVVDRDKKVLAWNRAIEEQTGVPKEDIIGKGDNVYTIPYYGKPRPNLIDLILSDDREAELLYDYVERKGNTISAEVYSPLVYGGKGAYLWGTASLLFDSDGNLVGAIQSNRDITKRKQFEQEMARLDRLNLVGEMAAGIGHEIRNPMTTVRGFLQMLGGKKECVQYKEYYDLMIEELDRANSIITEYLSLAKNKAVNLKAQNLNSIVRALSPLIQADAMVSDKFVKLELEDIPDLLLDRKEIRQLILNLVRNGLEAMSPGGNLTIRTFADGGEVVLAVQDQGKGIEPDVLEKIGTPFFTTKDYGTGLGMAVCYSIATRHNATIKVETGPEGTTFLVRFKYKAREDESALQ